MIDNEHQLRDLLERLQGASWIALDTEADSLHSYPEKICLLQLSFPGADEIVDPLAPLNLGPLLSLLAGRDLILHGADYDLRLLRRSWGFVPQSIFDTMLAARFLGLTEFGLTDLVAKYLGVTLEKGPQKANWGRRPLTDRMLTYACNDTHYLKPLADLLRQELTQKGRLPWHAEACACLVAECAQAQPRNPALAWRVKGSDKLSRKAQGVLREVWRWREREATHCHKPPYFVLSHEALTELAEKSLTLPVDSLLPAHWSPRRRIGLRQAIQRGLSLPSSKLPEPPTRPNRRLGEAAKRRLNELRDRRDRWATQLGLDPALIASRANLVLLAHDWDAHQGGLMAWQRELLRLGEPRGHH